MYSQPADASVLPGECPFGKQDLNNFKDDLRPDQSGLSTYLKLAKLLTKSIIGC